ncbi:MAG: response regulator transcription factor [Bdellovibrionales bacterium]|nr:response regulator transcription factor [Bdellovibrionales bacterium]
MDVLLIEDEIRVLKFLEDALRREGHTVHPCKSFEEARDFLAAPLKSLDIAIMDRLLHGRDSLDLVAQVRAKVPECGILILSAINSSEEKAAALDKGADDYLSKPFSLVELSARLRALSRRREGPARETTVMQRGNLTIDPISHIVSADGKRLDLSNKEYLLFYTLVQVPGRVYNKFQLLDKVWDMQFDIESNVVEVTVRNLRRKLEAASASVVIESKRNMGYWIEA